MPIIVPTVTESAWTHGVSALHRAQAHDEGDDPCATLQPAGMSHAKLLNYFESKNDLILAYVRYTREYMSEKCSQWFAGHDRADYASTSRT
ncbi:MAG: hypothetical protein ACLSHG_10510 [Oscillospiraceae bacterium]